MDETEASVSMDGAHWSDGHRTWCGPRKLTWVAIYSERRAMTRVFVGQVVVGEWIMLDSSTCLWEIVQAPADHGPWSCMGIAWY